MSDPSQDRVDITELIGRYAHALDSCDIPVAVECFCEDAVAHYEGGAIRVTGRPALEQLFTDSLTSPSTHLLSNLLIGFDGGEATACCSAIACVTRTPGFVTVRGLVYEMHCRKDPQHWRIDRLMHRPTWQFAVPGGPIGQTQGPS